MYVKNITWLDKESKEAEVEISDGVYSVFCFSQPFMGKVNEIYEDNIVCYDEEYVYTLDIEEYSVERISSNFEYILKGKIIDLDKKIMLLGKLKIDLSNIDMPGDIQEGEFIEIKVIRLDLY